MSDSPSFTPQQLAAARAAVWHQNGEPILTQEGMQDWVAQVGLVLYTPRPLQMPAPAPSFAEAAHGSTNAGMSLEQMEPARELLQRLTAGNHGIALNLLGTLGETPDYIVSAQALAFVFTLRGDKNWKKAPTSGGANKVSPLAVRVYELLAEHGALNTRDLIVHAGREVTEAAVLRALGELWSQLRVFPQPQADKTQTLWELASARFTKQLKAGSNAGVPTALSALISLYLGAVIAATTEEIEIFLSPLASRSRIREVVHGLMTTRQLEERVVEGKTLLHLVSGLPAFAPQFVEPRVKSDVNPEDLRSETETPAPGFTRRIANRSHRVRRCRRKPAGKSFGDKKPFRPRTDPGGPSPARGSLAASLGNYGAGSPASATEARSPSLRAVAQATVRHGAILATAKPHSAKRNPSAAHALRLAETSAASRTSPSRGRKRRSRVRVPMPALGSTLRPRVEPRAAMPRRAIRALMTQGTGCENRCAAPRVQAAYDGDARPPRG